MTTSSKLAKGVRVRVKKGAIILTTSPKKAIEAKRAYVVTLTDFYPAYEYTNHRGETSKNQALVEWTGAGGYWYRTTPENVEPVEG